MPPQQTAEDAIEESPQSSNLKRAASTGNDTLGEQGFHGFVMSY